MGKRCHDKTRSTYHNVCLLFCRKNGPRISTLHPFVTDERYANTGIASLPTPWMESVKLKNLSRLVIRFCRDSFSNLFLLLTRNYCIVRIVPGVHVKEESGADFIVASHIINYFVYYASCCCKMCCKQHSLSVCLCLCLCDCYCPSGNFLGSCLIYLVPCGGGGGGGRYNYYITKT